MESIKFLFKYYYHTFIEWFKRQWNLAFIDSNKHPEFKMLGDINNIKPGQVMIASNGNKFIKLSNGNFKLYKLKK